MKKPGTWQAARSLGSVDAKQPRRSLPGLLLGALLGAAALLSPVRAEEVLTNAAQVLSLSAEAAAKKLPVHVVGVVTVAEQGWGGEFFVQDATSGVFVGNRSAYHPQPGDLVEVTGITHPGSYAPTISNPKCTKIGTAPLPPALKVPIDKIMSGVEDGQRVEVTGIVRDVTPARTNIDLELSIGGYRLHAFPKMPESIDPATLVGARVRVQGTAAASFNAALRHMLTVVLFVPLHSDLVVEETESRNPFDEPLLPLKGVAQYRRDLAPGQRVHVKGVVTLQRPGEGLFIQDATAGLHVRSRQLGTLQVGDVVEAVGFPEFDHFLPVLDDAVFRRTKEISAPVKATHASVSEIEAGLHHAELISVSAKLLDRSFRRISIGRGRRPTRTVLLLQQGDLVFTAEADAPTAKTDLAAIPVGSTLEVTGVCLSESGEDKKLRSLQLLLPNAGSYRVLAKPSWFTPQRLLAGLAILLVLALLAGVWIVMISRRNAVLRELIREKEKAQESLQQARDQLEERVKERTAQLKSQITARKESELQFKAVLSERTRLAQELHDTLEQTLTGIALQLDTSTKLFPSKPDAANRHLGLARELVAQGQVDVRRSVWDLRSRALEQFDLPGALLTATQQLTDGTKVRFLVIAKGRVRPLPETIEENLLRIAQEAMTNIIKHSEATAAQIELDYGPKTVLLKVSDNGRGFDTALDTRPAEGHFGLLGISERAKRLGASFELQSSPGSGTIITVQLPIEIETPAPQPEPEVVGA